MTRHRKVRPAERTADRFAQVLGTRRGAHPFPASAAAAAAPGGERYGVFAQSVTGIYRLGGWHSSYGQALEAYELMHGASYRGHRLRHGGAGRRHEDVTLCVRSESDPAFAEAPRVEHARNPGRLWRRLLWPLWQRPRPAHPRWRRSRIRPPAGPRWHRRLVPRHRYQRAASRSGHRSGARPAH